MMSPTCAGCTHPRAMQLACVPLQAGQPGVPCRRWPRVCRAAQEAEEASAVDWGKLAIGGAATGRVHEVQDYGIVCDLDQHPDIVGLVSTHQVCAALDIAVPWI